MFFCVATRQAIRLACRWPPLNSIPHLDRWFWRVFSRNSEHDSQQHHKEGANVYSLHLNSKIGVFLLVVVNNNALSVVLAFPLQCPEDRRFRGFDPVENFAQRTEVAQIKFRKVWLLHANFWSWCSSGDVSKRGWKAASALRHRPATSAVTLQLFQ